MPRPPNPKLRLLRFWKRMWKDNPTLMEEARQRAVQSAQNAYRERNRKVASAVSAWPPELTNEQLKLRCLSWAEEWDFKPRSFKTKVVRLGLITYDPARKLWINRCLPNEKDSH